MSARIAPSGPGRASVTSKAGPVRDRRLSAVLEQVLHHAAIETLVRKRVLLVEPGAEIDIAVAAVELFEPVDHRIAQL